MLHPQGQYVHNCDIDLIHQQWVATLDAVRDAIVVLDKNGRIVRANRAFADLAGKQVEATIQFDIRDLLPWIIYDETGIAAVVQTSPDGRLFQVRSSTTTALLMGQIYILEDVTSESLFALAEKKYHSKSAIAFAETISILAKAQEVSDPYTNSHNLKVAEIARKISLAMGLGEQDAEGIYFGAEVHDIGKLSVPSSILNKPGRLAKAEMNLIRMHPETGFSIVKDLEFTWPVHDIILQHHERLDGSGYPYGLKGDEISMAAQIVAVADVVEAMSSHRPYRPALGIEAALEEIRRGKGKIYNTEVVEVCCGLIEAEDNSSEIMEVAHE